MFGCQGYFASIRAGQSVTKIHTRLKLDCYSKTQNQSLANLKHRKVITMANWAKLKAKTSFVVHVDSSKSAWSCNNTETKHVNSANYRSKFCTFPLSQLFPWHLWLPGFGIIFNLWYHNTPTQYLSASGFKSECHRDTNRVQVNKVDKEQTTMLQAWGHRNDDGKVSRA